LYLDPSNGIKTIRGVTGIDAENLDLTYTHNIAKSTLSTLSAGTQVTHNDVASAVIGITAKCLNTATCFQSLVCLASGRLLEPHKILALAFVDICDTLMKSWPVIDLTTEKFRDFPERLASKLVTTLFPHTPQSAQPLT